MNARNGWWLMMLAGTIALAGCVVAPGYVEASGPSVVTVPGPPPPALAVTVPPPPAVGMVWIGGDWFWRDRWIWRPGRWVNPPRPGVRWAPGHWWHREGRWFWRPGRWR